MAPWQARSRTIQYNTIQYSPGSNKPEAQRYCQLSSGKHVVNISGQRGGEGRTVISLAERSLAGLQEVGGGAPVTFLLVSVVRPAPQLAMINNVLG